MKVLVANVGSTSFKYKLFEMDDETVLARGGAERVKSEKGLFSYSAGDKPEVRLELPLPDHNAAIKLALDRLVDREMGVLSSLDELAAVGFKTVLAGDLPGTVLITDEVINKKIGKSLHLGGKSNISAIRRPGGAQYLTQFRKGDLSDFPAEVHIEQSKDRLPLSDRPKNKTSAFGIPTPGGFNKL